MRTLLAMTMVAGAMLGSAQVVRAQTAAGPSAADRSCRETPGAEALWANPDHRFLVFGEAHGTNEIPELFGDVVCEASASRPVVVALEWPPDLQASLDAYMASDGSGAARTRFLSAAFWSNPMPVGRTSQAMFRLIERLRALKASGRRVSVKTFEARVGLTFRQDYRELEMAQNLATIANSDPARPLVFVLTGNLHAGKLRYASMGGMLGAAGHLPPAEVVSLDAARNGGETWGCFSSKPTGVQVTLKDIVCGPHPWPLAPGGIMPRGITFTPSQGGMYDGVFSSGAPMTASAPPKRSGPAPAAD